jgi:hypothetical protein
MPLTLRALYSKRVIVLVLMGTGFSASCSSSNSGSNPAGVPASSANTTIDIATLDFDTPQLKNRFQVFDRTTRAVAAEEKGWKHRAYTQGGNFVSAVWVLGDGYDDKCRLGREPQHQVGTRKIEVDTIVVGDKAKSAAITLERVDASPEEWSVLCHYREATEQGVTGAGWGATLFKWDPQKQKSHVPFRPYEQTTVKFQLGSRYSYQVENTPVEVVSELPQEQDFLQYLASAESLRDTFLRANGKLLQKVEETISSHKAEKRIFGEYKGDGRPPPTSVKPLTATEETAELAKARKQFAELDRVVNKEYAAIHAALRKSFPFEKCWLELGAQENPTRAP